MICIPPPSVSHSCSLSLAYSHLSRVAARRGPDRAEGSGQQLDQASSLVFLSPHLFRLSWHITMYGPHSHLLAIRRLLVDSICQGLGKAAALTLLWLPLVKNISRVRCWHTNAHTSQPPLVLPGLAHPKEQWPVASGHPAWGLSGWRAKADPLLSLIRSLEFNLHHWQGPENKIRQRSLTPFTDSPFHGWLMGLEITAALHKLQLSRCKSVTTYRLKTKSLYLLTILVKMKDRILAK